MMSRTTPTKPGIASLWKADRDWGTAKGKTQERQKDDKMGAADSDGERKQGKKHGR
jgi:hypothetical protein